MILMYNPVIASSQWTSQVLFNLLPLVLSSLRSLHLTPALQCQIQFKILPQSSLLVAATVNIAVVILSNKYYKNDSRHPTGSTVSCICQLPFLEYLTVNPSWKMPVTSHGRDFPFYQRCWFCWKELHVWTLSASNTCDICYTCKENNLTLLTHGLVCIMELWGTWEVEQA